MLLWNYDVNGKSSPKKKLIRQEAVLYTLMLEARLAILTGLKGTI